MKNLLSRILAALCFVSFAACSSTTLIRSTDPSAKIYIDGEPRGTGSVSYSDTKIVGSTTSVRLSKAGCQDQSFTISRSEEFDVGACIGGVFVLVPFLWIEKYKPEHNYEFNCTPVGRER